MPSCIFIYLNFQESSPEIGQMIQKLEKERDSRNFTSVKPQKNTVLHRFDFWITFKTHTTFQLHYANEFRIKDNLVIVIIYDIFTRIFINYLNFNEI